MINKKEGGSEVPALQSWLPWGGGGLPPRRALQGPQLQPVCRCVGGQAVRGLSCHTLAFREIVCREYENSAFQKTGKGRRWLVSSGQCSVGLGSQGGSGCCLLHSTEVPLGFSGSTGSCIPIAGNLRTCFLQKSASFWQHHGIPTHLCCLRTLSALLL